MEVVLAPPVSTDRVSTFAPALRWRTRIGGICGALAGIMASFFLLSCENSETTRYELTSARIFDKNGIAKVQFSASEIARIPRKVLAELDGLAAQQDQFNQSLSKDAEQFPGMMGPYLVFLGFKNATKDGHFVSVGFFLNEDKRIVAAGESNLPDSNRPGETKLEHDPSNSKASRLNAFLSDLIAAHPTARRESPPPGEKPTPDPRIEMPPP